MYEAQSVGSMQPSLARPIDGEDSINDLVVPETSCDLVTELLLRARGAQLILWSGVFDVRLMYDCDVEYSVACYY